VIRSFRDKGLERFASQGDRSKLSVQNLARLERILTRLQLATTPEQMNLPGWRFHMLKGDQAGRYAIDASGNWRVTFGWSGDDAVEVDFEDYH
jgi:proteic killer suppression protein